MATVINRLKVTGDREKFEEILSGITAYMKSQPGYLGHELFRSTDGGDTYIEIARWSDAGAHRKAMEGAGFWERVRELTAHASAEPGLFEPVGD
ncbi:antibiotic biosynthesis monooxygenase family protein [Actinoallomurus sp. CA-150999]|uniref:antibiotic biosynthesis monooxygenase family protein n=1 Tax=Actinoallomurus sp. CA-150999 TaxID=3239887 RepID=UPI003D8BB081